MIVLREFLYLNTKILHDYLAHLEGYIEEEIDHDESSKTQKSGGVSKVIQGSVASEKSTGSKSKRKLTEPAQFQKLYQILDDSNQIQYLEAFDRAIWESLKKGEILEIQAQVSVPQFISQAEQFQGISSFANLATLFAPDTIQQSEIDKIRGFEELFGSVETKPVPILFQPIGAKRFNFTGDLQRDFLQCEMKELQGEVTVLGKVQRILRKGEKIEVFNFLPDMSAFGEQNRKQRRKMKSSKGKSKYKGLKESVKGPAIILTPLAVYR